MNERRKITKKILQNLGVLCICMLLMGIREIQITATQGDIKINAKTFWMDSFGRRLRNIVGKDYLLRSVQELSLCRQVMPQTRPCNITWKWIEKNRR